MIEAEIEAKIEQAFANRALELQFIRCDLTSLPDTIRHVIQLRRLHLSNNWLRKLPESIGNLRELRLLTLNNNQLRTLPKRIGNLQKLSQLWVDNNQLRELPESIGNLSQLRMLSLNNNQLRELPESIGNLTQLDSLYLSGNQLETLPESIGNLTHLRDLRLSNNRLRHLPDKLTLIPGLKRLDLSNNSQLASLPKGLRVEELDISGCTSLHTLPDDLVVKGRFEIGDTSLTALPPWLRRNLRWHGMWIDERIAVYPETITHEEVLAETNVERRRMLLERMGYERLMRLGQTNGLNTDGTVDRLLRTVLRVYNHMTRQPQLDVINTDYDVGGMRQLLRIRFRDDEPLVCLNVIDPSTGRQYMLRVPPTMTTCRQAAAWIAGFDNPEDYKPLVET